MGSEAHDECGAKIIFGDENAVCNKVFSCSKTTSEEILNALCLVHSCLFPFCCFGADLECRPCWVVAVVYVPDESNVVIAEMIFG